MAFDDYMHIERSVDHSGYRLLHAVNHLGECGKLSGFERGNLGEGRLEVTLRPPFDVIRREVQKVRAPEASGEDGTRTPPKRQDSNRHKGPNPSMVGISGEDFSAEMAKWREGRDSNPRRNLTSLTRLAGGRFQPLSHLPTRGRPV